MNTTYPPSTSSLPSLAAVSGIQRLQRVVTTAAKVLVAGLESALQPSKVADLRFPLFTPDDPETRRQREKPTHDDHLPPPC